MKKQIVSVMAVAGLSIASLAGAQELNIIGASAQYDFLNENVVNFVHQYCPTTVPAFVSLTTGTKGENFQYKTGNGNTIKHGVVTGSGCTGLPDGTTTLTVRYAGIASGEGIQARNNQPPLDLELNDGCTNSQRLMATTTGILPSTTCLQADGTTPKCVTDGDLPTYKTKTSCVSINIGTSDTAAKQFNQTYSNEWYSADGVTNTLAQLPTLTDPANNNDTVAVPFAFYVNPGVTARHCATTAAAGSVRTGGYCTSDANCLVGVCETNATTIDNLSRLQANILFNGQITNWNQLGAYFTSNDVKLCNRKPGSGTLVAFDKTVMSAGGTGWGAPFFKILNNDLTNSAPYNVFNGSSTDMKNCLAGTDGSLQADGVTPIPATGAVGYMDADTASSAGKYTRVAYNGVVPSRFNVRNGAYEFYSVGHMYTDASTMAGNLVTWVQDPTHVPSGKAKFWATAKEMQFVRGTDIAYPSKGTPTAIQTP